ncbi:hypothetical protein D8674_033657 [Pyrus ussuriensis x Pyrus communis]|uniref:Uncharacterized protein n=1 Tax=Pyrus ussuriensis x Pyrus communis TaxID=2448454 RepID=A0A5N5HRS5_9ROSA|nr:hypothetical protein D8674_033657 [Pyrus ussuriensis x Pyrus communis]
MPDWKRRWMTIVISGPTMGQETLIKEKGDSIEPRCRGGVHAENSHPNLVSRHWKVKTDIRSHPTIGGLEDFFSIPQSPKGPRNSSGLRSQYLCHQIARSRSCLVAL